MRRKQIEALPYGCGEQIDAADEWFGRFMKLWMGGNDSVGRCCWLADALNSAYRTLHFNDIWYQARRRWNYYRAEEERKNATER